MNKYKDYKIELIKLKEALLNELFFFNLFQKLDIKKIANAFEISEDDVEECFDNGHLSRGILAYVLCKSLNSSISEINKIKIKWTVQHGVGEKLYLSCSYEVNSHLLHLKHFLFHVRPDESKINYFLARFDTYSKKVAFFFVTKDD